MESLYEEQLGGQVLDEYGRGYVTRLLIGGPCRHCGRTLQKTGFCEVCGATLCVTCLSSTACDVLAPDGFTWSHGRAMRVRREELEASNERLAAERACDDVAPSLASQHAAQSALGTLGATENAPGGSGSYGGWMWL